ADSSARFAWADTVARLEDADEIAPGVRRIELGAPAMTTVALHVTRIDAGASFTFPSMTSSAIVAIMEGDGVSEMGGERFSWSRGDALAFPSGTEHKVTASTQAYLLSASDEPILNALGWLRPVPAAN
ncbi:MAG: cupin domain-containing protein, partial [Hyphomicrobiaceae bacterium]